MKAAWVIGLAFAAASSAAHANDWFSFDRNEALTRTRNAVERLKKVAPIPDLNCKPNPKILRHCSASLTKRLTFEIVETFDRSAGITGFQNGGPGKVYEIAARVDLDGADKAELEMFDTICTASVLALRPKLGPDAAFRRYSTALRRSMNKSKTDDSTVIVAGNPDSLVTSASRADLTCTVTAEDDYRQK